MQNTPFGQTLFYAPAGLAVGSGTVNYPPGQQPPNYPGIPVNLTTGVNTPSPYGYGQNVPSAGHQSSYGYRGATPSSSAPQSHPNYRSRQSPYGPGAHPHGSQFQNRPFYDASQSARALGPDQSSRPSRRHLKEEDFCPICTEVLPPHGENGDDSAREAHVDNCINNRFPSPRRPTAVPSGGSAPVVPQQSPSSGSSSMPKGHRRNTASRMFKYYATEKDAIDADGRTAECVICFEDFEPGQELSRLECLCKYHTVSQVSTSLYSCIIWRIWPLAPY
jgi:hypothetical protein